MDHWVVFTIENLLEDIICISIPFNPCCWDLKIRYVILGTKTVYRRSISYRFEWKEKDPNRYNRSFCCNSNVLEPIKWRTNIFMILVASYDEIVNERVPIAGICYKVTTALGFRCISSFSKQIMWWCCNRVKIWRLALRNWNTKSHLFMFEPHCLDILRLEISSKFAFCVFEHTLKWNKRVDVWNWLARLKFA